MGVIEFYDNNINIFNPKNEIELEIILKNRLKIIDDCILEDFRQEKILLNTQLLKTIEIKKCQNDILIYYYDTFYELLNDMFLFIINKFNFLIIILIQKYNEFIKTFKNSFNYKRKFISKIINNSDIHLIKNDYFLIKIDFIKDKISKNLLFEYGFRNIGMSTNYKTKNRKEEDFKLIHNYWETISNENFSSLLSQHIPISEKIFTQEISTLMNSIYQNLINTINYNYIKNRKNYGILK